MTDGEIESAVARPFTQSRGAAHEVAGFSRNRTAAMATNDMGQHSCLAGKFDSLREITRGDLDCVAARNEFRNQRMEKRNVRGIGEIDPDAHGSLKRKG